MTEASRLEALFTLHTGIPREAPGSDATTREAIRRLPPLPRAPRILDIGCGPGRQTLVLARFYDGVVTAVDIHEPFLARLREAAAKAGLSDRVDPQNASMDSLGFPPESFDLIWAEGSVYIVGFSQALRLWRPLLRSRGLMAVSELTWLTGDPPAAPRDYWSREYAAIGSVPENVQRAEAEGYEVLDTFPVPPKDWWREYLGPLERRIHRLRPQAGEDAALARVLDDTEQEIDICRSWGDSFGYVFYLMRKR